MTAMRLPCGCVMDQVEETFVYQPCSVDCRYWLYVQERIEARQIPTTYVFDPEER